MKYLLIAAIIFCTSCQLVQGDRIDGNGSTIKKNKEISGFEGVEVDGPFKIILMQGNSFSVSIEADENLQDFIEIKKHNNNIEISEKEGYSLHSKNDIIVRIQIPQLNEATVSGSGSIKGENQFTNTDGMEITIGGSGTITLAVKSPKLDVEIGGSGKATLSGSTQKLDISIGGSGDCYAEELLSEECDISIGGSGTAKVYASVRLAGSIGGSGNIYYRGEPKDVSKSIGGSGSIEAIK